MNKAFNVTIRKNKEEEEKKFFFPFQIKVKIMNFFLHYSKENWCVNVLKAKQQHFNSLNVLHIIVNATQNQNSKK